MAGWDHYFEVDGRDIDLLRICLRIWRRTCARYYIDFTYHCEQLRDGPRPRRRYVLTYDLHSTNAPLAVEEFAIEMRAISTAQGGRPRRRRLPLRLLRDVAWMNTPEPVANQVDDGRVHPSVRMSVVESLERFQEAHSAFRRAQLPAAAFLEAQHSLILELGLTIGQAGTKDSYPALVDKLTEDSDLRRRLKELGTWRNAVKHRGRHELADEVAEKGLSIVWTATERFTGAYVDPVSKRLRELGSDPDSVFRLPPMFGRYGAPRRPQR